MLEAIHECDREDEMSESKQELRECKTCVPLKADLDASSNALCAVCANSSDCDSKDGPGVSWPCFEAVDTSDLTRLRAERTEELVPSAVEVLRVALGKVKGLAISQAEVKRLRIRAKSIADGHLGRGNAGMVRRDDVYTLLDSGPAVAEGEQDEAQGLREDLSVARQSLYEVAEQRNNLEAELAAANERIAYLEARTVVAPQPSQPAEPERRHLCPECKDDACDGLSNGVFTCQMFQPADAQEGGALERLKHDGPTMSAAQTRLLMKMLESLTRRLTEVEERLCGVEDGEQGRACADRNCLDCANNCPAAGKKDSPGDEYWHSCFIPKPKPSGDPERPLGGER
jgi:hypothetical protein